jgi:hypothetical protein
VPGNPANNNEIKCVSRRKVIRLTTLIISSHFIVRYSSTVISEELESLEAADTTHSTNLFIRSISTVKQQQQQQKNVLVWISPNGFLVVVLVASI